MCIFVHPVVSVKETRILVSPTTTKGRQVTIYENFVGVNGGRKMAGGDAKRKQMKEEQKKKLADANAMILPCPLNSDTSEVQLLDFSKPKAKSAMSDRGPVFDFKDLEKCFPEIKGPPVRSRSRGAILKSARNVLEITKVGAYDCSVAKCLEDLKKIDRSVLRVPDDIYQLLGKHYETGFGFVICQFDPEAQVDPHPMGYVHDTIQGSKLFVPCRHEHGDGEDAKAGFDHKIYSIGTRGDEAGLSPEELENTFVKRIKTNATFKYHTIVKAKAIPKEILSRGPLKGLIPEGAVLRRKEVKGMQTNEDYIFAYGA